MERSLFDMCMMSEKIITLMDGSYKVQNLKYRKLSELAHTIHTTIHTSTNDNINVFATQNDQVDGLQLLP